MQRMTRLAVGLLIASLVGSSVAAPPLSFDSQSSKIGVKSGAKLKINKEITSFDGTLEKETSGEISGQKIIFTKGILKDECNELLLTATFDPSGILILDGDKLVRSEAGTVLQTISVSGINNRIEGQPILTGDITLTDANSTLTVAVQSDVNQNINLNGGTIVLENELRFTDNKNFEGSGTIDGNGYKITLGAKPLTIDHDLSLKDCTHLNLCACPTTIDANITFNGNTGINGNGNVLDLGSSAVLTIPSNSKLTLSDMTLKGLDDSKIVFTDDTSELCLCDTDIEFDGDVTIIKGKVTVNTNSSWILKDNSWDFGGTSTLTINGVTLCKDRSGAATAGDITFSVAGNENILDDGIIKTCDAEDCCDALRTSTGFLQSQIDAIEDCCEPLKTSTGFLQSQIDALDSCCDELKTSTGELQSQVDECCTELKTSTGFLQSQIDDCCDVIESCCDELKTSTGELQSQIDECCTELKTSTGFLQSQIDALDSCCDELKTSTGFLQSQIDDCCDVIESCCDELKTSTGELQSQIDECCTELKTSTGFLQSQIDTLDSCCDELKTSTGFLQSQIDDCCDVIESCCDELKTSTGELQSQIDECCTELKTSTGFLQSQIDDCCDVIESCCDDLKTSTGELQSQIDECCTELKTSTGFLQSQIDVLDSCCDELKTSTGGLQSQIDVLDSCCDELSTSTGFLQSQIDQIEDCECDPSLIDCCYVQSITQEAQPDNIETLDWDHTNQYVVVGLDDNGTPTPDEQNVLRVYEFTTPLTLKATYSFDGEGYHEVAITRWHPSKHFVAVGRLASPGTTDAGLHIFSFDPNEADPTLAFTLTFSTEIDNDVVALAWHPDGDRLAVGRDVDGSEIIVYSVNASGVITDPGAAVTADTDSGGSNGQIQSQAMDFDKMGDRIVVGVNKDSTDGGLQVWDFAKGSPDTLALSVGVDVESVPATKQTVRSVDWNKTHKNTLAVGIEGTTGEQLQIYRHDPDLDTLTRKGGSMDMKEVVRAVHWSPNGRCLAVGRNNPATGGGEFITFTFTQSSYSLTKKSEFDDFDNNPVEAVRWSPNGGCVASGSDVNRLTIYQSECLFISSRIDVLETCCDELRTSTGFLQSQIDNIDDCCTPLKTSTGFLQSQIDALDSCCDELKTSTGGLQSQIDVLDSCCDALSTSTGFLQSQIDNIDDCCTPLKTSTGFLQSQIDALDSCCDELKTSTGELQSQIDECCTELKTSTGFLQSQIDVIDSCCDELKTSTGELQSQIDLLDSCCDELRTSTGELQSQIDECCTELKTSTGFLQSQIDALDSCCDELKTSTGGLQSQIDVLDSCCDELSTSTGGLQSQIDVLDSCCDELSTSTGFLQSQIDNIDDCCTPLKTSTGFLQSQIDALDSCCDELKTSTGELQSQIDECCDVLRKPCCNIALRDTKPELDCVETTDWSHDGKYVAVGVAVDNVNVAGYVKVYERVGAALVLRATYAAADFGNEREVSSVRFHPELVGGKYRLAVGRIGTEEDCDDPGTEPECHNLHILDFDPAGPSITQVSQGEFNRNVYALDWRSPGLGGGAYALGVGRDANKPSGPVVDELAVYSVVTVPAATLPAPIVTASAGAQVQTQAMDWNRAGDLLGVGVDKASASNSLQIWEFNPAGSTLTPDVTTQINVSGTDRTVRALEWCSDVDCDTFFAVGLQGPGPDKLVQVLKHATGSVTFVDSIDDVPEMVRTLDWSPDCRCVVFGTNGDTGTPGELFTYEFDKCKEKLGDTPVNEFNLFGDNSVESVRWAPDGKWVVSGSDDENTRLYENDCSGSFVDVAALCDLECRVEKLETCCDELRTSTGGLQSQIDVLDSCCDALSTSTGFLQSQIDNIDDCCDPLRTSTGFLQSQIDALDSCCDELRTSTGFLQSQIDECCDGAGDCVVSITADTIFNPNTMIPAEGFAIKFSFDKCFGPCDATPRLIFPQDLAFDLPPSSRMIFCGEGIVELRDGVHITPCGTPYCLIEPADRSDWPSIIVEEGAVMTLANKATAIIGGRGDACGPDKPAAAKIIVRHHGSLRLDQPSQLIIGKTIEDDFEVSVLFDSNMTVENSTVDLLTIQGQTNQDVSQDALITFQQGCVDLIFDHQSAMSILLGGVIEFNMHRGAASDLDGNPAEGVLRKLFFEEGSLLNVQRRGTETGVLRLAPNFNVNPPNLSSDINVDFNNKSGEVIGDGHEQFKEFVLVDCGGGGTPFVLANDTVYQQGGVITAGTTVPSAVTISSFALERRFQLTAATLLPAGTVIEAGSVLSGVVQTADMTLGANTVLPRGDILAEDTVIASQTISGTLANAVLLAPGTNQDAAVNPPGGVSGTKLPAGTSLAAGSEIVNTTLDLQDNVFEIIRPIVEMFMELAYILPGQDSVRAPVDTFILVRKGSFVPSEDGRLAALCPPIRDGVNRDGKIVGLQPGDTDVGYNQSTGSSVLNEVIGKAFGTTTFVIDNCDESTRV